MRVAFQLNLRKTTLQIFKYLKQMKQLTKQLKLRRKRQDDIKAVMKDMRYIATARLKRYIQ